MYGGKINVLLSRRVVAYSGHITSWSLASNSFSRLHQSIELWPDARDRLSESVMHHYEMVIQRRSFVIYADKNVQVMSQNRIDVAAPQITGIQIGTTV